MAPGLEELSPSKKQRPEDETGIPDRRKNNYQFQGDEAEEPPEKAPTAYLALSCPSLRSSGDAAPLPRERLPVSPTASGAEVSESDCSVTSSGEPRGGGEGGGD